MSDSPLRKSSAPVRTASTPNIKGVPRPLEPIKDAATTPVSTLLPTWLRQHEHYKAVHDDDVDELVSKRERGYYVRPKAVERPASHSWLGKHARAATPLDESINVVKGPHGTPAAWLKPSLRPTTSLRKRSIAGLTPKSLGLSKSAASLLPSFQSRQILSAANTMRSQDDNVAARSDPVAHATNPTANRVAAILADALSDSIGHSGVASLAKTAQAASQRRLSAHEQRESYRRRSLSGRRRSVSSEGRRIASLPGVDDETNPTLVTWTPEVNHDEVFANAVEDELGIKFEPKNRPQQTTRGDHSHPMDFAEAERLMQRAFVLRAKTLGYDDDATMQARGNLMRLYMAQGKREDAEQVRDDPAEHFRMVESQLEAFDKIARRETINRKLKLAVKSVGALSLLHKDTSTEASPAKLQASVVSKQEAIGVRDSITSVESLLPTYADGEYKPVLSAHDTTDQSDATSFNASNPSEITANPGSVAVPTNSTSVVAPTNTSVKHTLGRVGGEVAHNVADMLTEEGKTVGSDANSLFDRVLRAIQPPVDLSAFPHRDDYAVRVLLQNAGVTPAASLRRIGQQRERITGSESGLDLQLLPSHAKVVPLVFGEPLRLRIEYQCDDPTRRHHPKDWIGLFRVIPRGRECADSVWHGSSGGGGAADSSARTSLSQLQGMDNIKAQVDSIKKDNISEFRDPTRSVYLNRKVCFDPLKVPAILTRTQSQVKRVERVLKNKAPSHDVMPELLAAAHHYDDEEVPEEFDEVLDAWLPTPPSTNKGIITFPISSPSRVGVFRVKYFLQGSPISVGFPLTVWVREVVCSVDAPQNVTCGEGFPAKFVLHYNLNNFQAELEKMNTTARRGVRLADIVGSYERALRVRQSLLEFAQKVSSESPVVGRRSLLSPKGFTPATNATQSDALEPKTRVWAGLFLKHSNAAVSTDEINPSECPYDRNRPIESHWLPKQIRGTIHFGINPRGVGNGLGHPVWPGVYEVRLYTVDPGLTPTLDGIEQPSAGRPTKKTHKPGVVYSRCVAISQHIVARMRTPPRLPAFEVTAPLRRELRVYLSASTIGTGIERETILKQGLPALRRICDQRSVALTVVDLRQRVVQKVQAERRGSIDNKGAMTAKGGTTSSSSTMGKSVVNRRSSLQRTEEVKATGRRSSTNPAPDTLTTTSSRSFQMDVPSLLGEALLEIEECRPHVITLLTNHYDVAPPAAVPAWIIHAFPWLRNYKNADGSSTAHTTSRGSVSVFKLGSHNTSGFASPRTVAVSDDFYHPQYVFPRQDHGDVDQMAHISVLDAEFTSAFRLPALDSMHDNSHALSTAVTTTVEANKAATSNVGFFLTETSIAAEGKNTSNTFDLFAERLRQAPPARIAFPAHRSNSLEHNSNKTTPFAKTARPVSSRKHNILQAEQLHAYDSLLLEPSTELPVIQESLANVVAGDGDGGDNSTMFAYVRHPSSMPAYSVAEAYTQEKYGLDSKTGDPALASIKMYAELLAEKTRHGFHKPTELLNWFNADVFGMIARSFPMENAPSIKDLWTIASAAYISAHGGYFAYCRATAAACRRISQYATTSIPIVKPLCLVGSAGVGKSTLLGIWLKLFVRESMETTIAFMKKTVTRNRMQMYVSALLNANARVLAAQAENDPSAVSAAFAALQRLRNAAGTYGMSDRQVHMLLTQPEYAKAKATGKRMSLLEKLQTEDDADSNDSSDDSDGDATARDITDYMGDPSLLAGAQLTAIKAFSAAGKHATADWQFAINLPQPQAAHTRLRYINEDGEDVCFFFLHVGEAGNPSTGTEFLYWLVDELIAAAHFEAKLDHETLMQALQGTLPPAPSLDERSFITGAPAPVADALKRMYGHQITSLLTASKTTYIEEIKAAGQAVKDAIFNAEPENVIRGAVLRLLAVFVGDSDVDVMSETLRRIDIFKGANNSASSDMHLQDMFNVLDQYDGNVSTRRRLVLVLDGIDQLTQNDDLAGALHGHRVTAAAAAEGGRTRRRSSVMLDPAAVSMMAQGVRVPVKRSGKTAIRYGKKSDNPFQSSSPSSPTHDTTADESAGAPSSSTSADNNKAPPPLWYLPSQLPPRCCLVLSAVEASKSFDALRVRGWLGEDTAKKQQQTAAAGGSKKAKHKHGHSHHQRKQSVATSETSDTRSSHHHHAPPPPATAGVSDMLRRQTSVRSRMMADLLGDVKKPAVEVGLVEKRGQLVPLPQVRMSGMGFSLQQQRGSLSPGRRIPGPPPRYMQEQLQAMRRQRLLEKAEEEVERGSVLASQVFVPHFNHQAAKTLLQNAWNYSTRGMGAEWGESAGWSLRVLLDHPSPSTVDYVTYTPPDDEPSSAAGVLFTAASRQTSQQSNSAIPGLEARRRSSVIDATQAATAMAAAASAARAIIPVAGSITHKGDGLDDQSMALLKSPARGQLLASVEGRIRSFGDALVKTAAVGKDAKTTSTSAAQTLRRASSCGPPLPLSKANKAQPIAPLNPLEAVDREHVRPKPKETLRSVLIRLITEPVVTEMPKTSATQDFDLRSAANAAQQRTELHQRPQFLRFAIARLGMCKTAEQALSAAARLRSCNTIDDAATELLTALEGEHPLAIEVLCFLRVAARGLQEQELIDLLGGGAAPLQQSPHVRPPLLHDRALQSIMQIQVTHPSLSKQYQAALAHAIATCSMQMESTAEMHATTATAAASDDEGTRGGVYTKASSSPNNGSSTTPAVPLPPAFLPKVFLLPPKSAPLFTPRAWSAARRILLSCFITRSRGLWCLDGSVIRTCIDRWLLPTQAQRVLYIQHIAAYFWMAQPSLRKAEELIPALLTLTEASRMSKQKTPLWKLGKDDPSESSLSLVPYGVVPGDFVTPAAADALAAIEANHRIASRLAFVLRSGKTTRKDESTDESAPVAAPATSSDKADLQRAAVQAALSSGNHDAMRSVAIAQVNSLLERRPSYMLLSGWPASAALPIHEAILSGSLLTCCTDMKFVMYVDTVGEPLRTLLFQGLLSTFRTSVQLSAALRTSFEAYHGICGYNRSPQYHLINGCIIDPKYTKELEDMDPAARLKRARDPTRSTSIAHGGVLVTQDMFNRIRKQGVKQLLVISRILIDLGQYTGAQSMLEASILLNLAGFDGRDERSRTQAPKLSNDAVAQPLIKSISLLVAGFQQCVHKLETVADLLGRPAADIDDAADANVIPWEAIEALKRIATTPRAPPRPGSPDAKTGSPTPSMHHHHHHSHAVAAAAATATTTAAAAASDRVLLPMVAGHAAWDIPSFSTSHMLTLSINNEANAEKAGRAQDESGMAEEDELAVDDSSSGVIMGRGDIWGVGKPSVPEPIDAIIARYNPQQKPTVKEPTVRTNLEQRTTSLLAAVVRSMITDREEAIRMLEQATGDLDKDKSITGSNANLPTSSETSSPSKAVKNEKDEIIDAMKMGYGPSLSEQPHIMDVEFLAEALGKLACLLVERLHAYVQYIQLQGLDARLPPQASMATLSPKKRRNHLTAAADTEVTASDGRRLSTVFPNAAAAATAAAENKGVGAKFEIHPQHIANKLIAIHKLATRLDRIIGPRHPELRHVGKALRSAKMIAEELQAMGYLLILQEAEGLLAVRKRQQKQEEDAQDEAARLEMEL